ncbi:hypothetical protein K493DRAFT_318726 [Basidiobolus meristosporus CBS 931.73]|uniref:WRKY domain-containing protein n=1 Tax=Basidiobolus meristosporus CBS 931.73 TaxID=1314790 RepID=A0A1Y1XUJ5_9FUNG|nr:hypothetical protein K493DRAFT_318726 [Basidiobolus meristosporus CBS 931.73]|eukprot:ORX89393.1 hypothetical protein K493DRAFT_318726 [Basidiobolus meristosporus CBS 931.73]
MTGNNPPFFHKSERAHSLPEFSPPGPRFELVDLLSHYSNQPELLKLILQSKLQEDKRKTEETRLRSMQLDLMMYEQSNPSMCLWPEPGTKRGRDELFPELLDMGKNTRLRIEPDPFAVAEFPQGPDFSDFPDYANFSSAMTSNDSSDTASPPTLFSALENDSFLSHPSTDSSPTIPGFPNLISPTSIAAPAIPGLIPVSNSLDSIHNSATPLAPNSNASQFPHSKPDKKKRNRKAMLPISMIVETKEFPYLDNYVWLNNGNTIQKKTGLRSTYYKCANWHKGCSVNKTVSSQGDGAYIIKYRGEHLPECRMAAKTSS